MADAVADGEVTHPMIHRLAVLGAEAASHAPRHVLGLMEQCGFLSLISEIWTPLASHCILPSSMLKHVYDNYPLVFAKTVGADRDKVRSFGASFRANPEVATFLAGHPQLQGMAEGDWEYLIPLTFHEDAGPFAKKKSCNVLSFSTLLGDETENLRQWTIASYIKTGPATNEQLAALWAPLLADLRSLAEGRDIGPWRFILLFAKADLECRSNSWGLPHYNAAREPCSECTANRSTMPFTDLRASAAWRSAPALTPAAYIARCRAPLHPLVSSDFSWRYFFPLDCMHICDCNGVTATLAGSLIRPLVMSDSRLGHRIDLRLKAVNDRLTAFYDARPRYNRMPALRVHNLDLDGWACLSGGTVKAASTRGLALFLVELCEEFYADSDDEYQRCVSRAARALSQFYVVLYGGDRFLTASEQNGVRRALSMLGACFQQLRNIAQERGLLAWNISPKTHMVQHFKDLCKIMNPRFLHNYAEESHIGTMTKMWARSAQGRYSGSVQKLSLVKRLVAVNVRMLRAEQELRDQ